MPALHTPTTRCCNRHSCVAAQYPSRHIISHYQPRAVRANSSQRPEMQAQQTPLGAPVQELLSYHTAQAAAVLQEATPAAGAQQLRPKRMHRPQAARLLSPEARLSRLRQFKGIVNDPSRPYQHDIMLHLLFSPAVPKHARQLYRSMKANTLQEAIRRRVKVQGELAKCIQSAEHQHEMLTAWHRNAHKKQQLNPAALVQELPTILRIKTRLGGVRAQLIKAVEEARAWQDTDYVDYASQHFPTLDALEQWLDLCRKVYYPWMQQMQRVNANYARRAAITGVCAEIERRREAELERVHDITIQEVPTFAYDTRYPPQGTVIPNMEEVKLYERIKAVTEDPEYQPRPPTLNRPALFQPPSLEHLQKPNQFVLPGAFD